MKGWGLRRRCGRRPPGEASDLRGAFEYQIPALSGVGEKSDGSCILPSEALQRAEQAGACADGYFLLRGGVDERGAMTPAEMARVGMNCASA